MMNPVIKAKWVAALRSGKYKQGHGKLRTARTFCCLGVLCDLHAKATGSVWTIPYRKYEYFDFDGVLPPVVQEWADLDNCRVEVAPDLTLTALNDGEQEYNIGPATFQQIADIIETTL